MLSRQIRRDLKKFLGLTKKHESPAARPRIYGGVGLVKKPVLVEDKVECLETDDLLKFVDGKPTTDTARVIDSFFEKKTGRQVRIFLDPAAEICSEVQNVSNFVWYKLGVVARKKVKMRPVSYDLPEKNQWGGFTVHGFRFGIAYKSSDTGVIRASEYDDSHFELLSKTDLYKPFFFTTVRLPIPQTNFPPPFLQSEKYLPAVQEIYDYFCSIVNNICPDQRVTNWINRSNGKGFVYDVKLSTSAAWPMRQIFSACGAQLKLNLNDYGGSFWWKGAGSVLSYHSLDAWELEGKDVFWTGNPPRDGKYDSRLRFADDLVAAPLALLMKADEDEGVIRGRYIESFDTVEAGQQLGVEPVEVYHRAADENDYKLLGTIPSKGYVVVWEVETWPDQSIIDLKFDPQTATFKPFHPKDAHLIPDGLKGLQRLVLESSDGVEYEIYQAENGFRVRNESKEWEISYGRFEIRQL